MPDLQPLPDEPRRLCVFRALRLGDMLCAGPALRALRARFPDARITLVGLPWAADFASRLSACVDEFVAFPGWPGLPEQPVDEPRRAAFVEDMRARGFDLALQLHGDGRLTNRIVAAFGAARMLGHHPAGAARPAHGDGLPAAGAEALWPYPDALNEVHRNLQLVARLGADVRDDRLLFPLGPADEAALRTRRPELAALPAGHYACLHPGARDPARRWPPAWFARVGDALAAQRLQVVVTGDASEASLADAVCAGMSAPAQHAACDIPVGALAWLLARSALLVCNDTGVSHLAAALRLPSVVVFLATDPARWAPLDRHRHVVVRDPAGGAPAPHAVIEAALGLLPSRVE